MLTKKDLQEIKKLVDERLEIKLEEKLNEKLEQKFNEKLKYLPSKDEFYEKMDEIMGELKAIREEQMVMSHQLSESHDQLDNHEGRIKKLEDVLQS
jgi:hypothetical protein